MIYMFNCATKGSYVAIVLNSGPFNIQFRRSLVRERWNEWLHLVRRLMDVQLSDHEDAIHWKLVANETFSVKSMYLDLIDSGHCLGHCTYGILKFHSELRFSCSSFTKESY